MTNFDTKFRSLEDGIRKSNSFRNNRQGILKNKEISDWWMIVWCCLRHIGSTFQPCKGVCSHMILTNKQIQWEKPESYSCKTGIYEEKNVSIMRGKSFIMEKWENAHFMIHVFNYNFKQCTILTFTRNRNKFISSYLYRYLHWNKN